MLPSQREWVAAFERKEPSEFRRSFMARRIFPLKVGDVLLTVPESEVEENMQFILNIAFAEPEIVKGNPVIETLHEMRKSIHHLIFEFERWGLFR